MLKILCQNNKVAPINSDLSETKTIRENVRARKRKPDNPHLLGCRHITNTDYKTQMELKRSRAVLLLNGLFFLGQAVPPRYFTHVYKNIKLYHWLGLRQGGGAFWAFLCSGSESLARVTLHVPVRRSALVPFQLRYESVME